MQVGDCSRSQRILVHWSTLGSTYKARQQIQEGCAPGPKTYSMVRWVNNANSSATLPRGPFSAGAGIMRIQRLTLRLVAHATQPAEGQPSGQVVPLPPIQQSPGVRGAKLRRPSVMAMQMGLLPGPQADLAPISQVCPSSHVQSCLRLCTSQESLNLLASQSVVSC
jgi:hypothetical protein